MTATTPHSCSPPPGTWCVAASLVAVLLLPVVSEASVDPDTWGGRVQRSDALLRQGDYAAAYEITDRLLDEVGGYLLPDERSEAALGVVLALQAVAEAGTGRTEAALWHWHFAQSLKKDLRSSDLSVYGAAGDSLDPHRYPVGEDGGCVAETQEVGLAGEGGPRDPGGELTPPVKVHAPPPSYSLEERAAGLEGVVIIQAVIDREGRLKAPYLLKADAPSFAYRAAEAMREWRFKPARLDGEPVTVFYNLVVNFNLKK